MHKKTLEKGKFGTLSAKIHKMCVNKILSGCFFPKNCKTIKDKGVEWGNFTKVQHESAHFGVPCKEEILMGIQFD